VVEAVVDVDEIDRPVREGKPLGVGDDHSEKERVSPRPFPGAPRRVSRCTPRPSRTRPRR
jgi:hypothetical protein